MAKKRVPIDDLIDALMWMRRKAKKRKPIDEVVDALMSMRRKAKKKAAKRKRNSKATRIKKKRR